MMVDILLKKKLKKKIDENAKSSHYVNYFRYSRKKLELNKIIVSNFFPTTSEALTFYFFMN
jgi:hypothetical protein